MQHKDLTTGKVTNVLLALALPIMGSSLLQFTYNLIDMLWIGKLGSDAVASIGSASFFINLGYALHAFIVIGAGIKVAFYLGKKDTLVAKQYMDTAIHLTMLLGIAYGLILLFFGKSFIAFLHLENATVSQQAFLYLLGNIPVLFLAFFNTLFARLFASLGNTTQALRISCIGTVLNLVLDPLLIYTSGLGILGAALATLIANLVMLLCYLHKGRSYLQLRRFSTFDPAKAKEISLLGMPISFQRILFTSISILLARLIATFGADAIAAQKIGLQIESVTYMLTGGLNGAIASFIGQNHGAKQYGRMRQGYYTALVLGCTYALLSSVVFWFAGSGLASLFVKEAPTILLTSGYLKIIAISQLFNAMEMVSNGYFTGLGKPKVPATISMLFTACRLPLALLLIPTLGLDGIWWSISLSTIFKGCVLYILQVKSSKSLQPL